MAEKRASGGQTRPPCAAGWFVTGPFASDRYSLRPPTGSLFMPTSAIAYDLTLLLDTAADEAQRTKVLEDVKKIIAAAGAEVASNHAWGTRRTAFEIKHKNEAEMHLVQFVGNSQLPAQLSHTLRITDGIVRFRIIRRPKGPGAVPDIGAMPQPAGASAPLEAAPAVERL